MPLKLFEGYGIELEYAIVDESTLSVAPLAAELIREATGLYQCDAELGDLGWSNEMVLHVLEIKTEEPAASFDGLNAKFMDQVRRINGMLASHRAMLLPAGMHPWMDPKTETRLWPYENRHIYETFDRIFDCRRHGWANLQSCQLNLPFDGEEEFGRLHAAVRLLLPLMPGLAASTPIRESCVTGFMDTRMEVYRTNAAKIPAITGEVVPEPIFTPAAYQDLLKSIYRDIAPEDPEGVLQHEWLNARGAIARFDRNAIEIRVLDSQEYPGADLAICGAVSAVLKALTDEKCSDWESQKKWSAEELEPLLRKVLRDADLAVIDNRRYLEVLGLGSAKSRRVRDIWSALIEKWLPGEMRSKEFNEALSHILEKGVLARRILKALGHDFSREKMKGVYARLAACLRGGELFHA